jgi:hypothetical protein
MRLLQTLLVRLLQMLLVRLLQMLLVRLLQTLLIPVRQTLLQVKLTVCQTMPLANVYIVNSLMWTSQVYPWTLASSVSISSI